MNVFSMCQYVSEILDASSFDDVCINGLQVEGTRPIAAIATAVSPSLFVINEAEKYGAELLLTHHALFLKSPGVPLSGNLSRRVRSLYRADMHLLSYHLPLDAHQELGNAWPVLRDLGYTSLEPFGKYLNKAIGVRGISLPTSQRGLFERLQNYFGTPGVLFGENASKEVRSIAFVSGGGHRFLSEAIHQKIDCFITGTVDEAVWSLAREEGVCVMAFGHYATEKKGVQLLGEHLKQKFGVEHIFIQEKNPL